MKRTRSEIITQMVELYHEFRPEAESHEWLKFLSGIGFNILKYHVTEKFGNTIDEMTIYNKDLKTKELYYFNWKK